MYILSRVKCITSNNIIYNMITIIYFSYHFIEPFIHDIDRVTTLGEWNCSFDFDLTYTC